MRRWRLSIALVVMPLMCSADPAPLSIDLADTAALREGAQTFSRYCMGCHGTRLQRYERVADDLGIPHDSMLNSLAVPGATIGDHMTTALREADARQWFGAVPPDLTLAARVRGPDWLYRYLTGFYDDPARPLGVNNALVPNVAMPDVLAGLRQQQTPQQFDASVRNLVAFMAYSAHPAAVRSQRIGTYVLLYLGLFLVLVYALKREYWKDVDRN